MNRICTGPTVAPAEPAPNNPTTHAAHSAATAEPLLTPITPPGTSKNQQPRRPTASTWSNHYRTARREKQAGDPRQPPPALSDPRHREVECKSTKTKMRSAIANAI